MVRDRREVGARRALVQQIMSEVFRRPWFTVDASNCPQMFGIPDEVCVRILLELERAGIIRQTRPGVWTRRSPA